jgi:hypothetical protein
MGEARNENGCIGKQTHTWTQVVMGRMVRASDDAIVLPTHWRCVWCGALMSIDKSVGRDATCSFFEEREQ